MHSDGFHPRTALPEDGLGAGEMPGGGVPSTRDPPVLKHPQAVHHGTVEKCNASPYFRNLAVWHKRRPHRKICRFLNYRYTYTSTGK